MRNPPRRVVEAELVGKIQRRYVREVNPWWYSKDARKAVEHARIKAWMFLVLLECGHRVRRVKSTSHGPRDYLRCEKCGRTSPPNPSGRGDRSVRSTEKEKR